MLPRDCFPKIADWMKYIYIYIYRFEGKQATTRLYHTMEKRETCRLFFLSYVDLEKGEY